MNRGNLKRGSDLTGKENKRQRRELTTKEEERPTNGTRSVPMQPTAKVAAPWPVRRLWAWENRIPELNKMLQQAPEHAGKWQSNIVGRSKCSWREKGAGRKQMQQTHRKKDGRSHGTLAGETRWEADARCANNMILPIHMPGT